MTPMNLHGKSQRLLPTLRMCALMAGLAVFVWGTGYKVSLYLNLGRAHGGIPPAKLLSPEQRSTNEAKVAISSAPANLVILFLSLPSLVSDRANSRLAAFECSPFGDQAERSFRPQAEPGTHILRIPPASLLHFLLSIGLIRSQQITGPGTLPQSRVSARSS